MPVSVGMVLLDQTCPVSASEIERTWRDTWPTSPPATDFSEKENIISFRVGEVMVFLAEMDAPVPWTDLEGPCATSILWPRVEAAVRPHRAHWILSLAGEFDPVNGAALLTRVMAVFLKCCPAALGVYWGNAALLVPKPFFIDFAERVLPEGPPVLIWIDFRVGSEKARTSSGFTNGMKALGFMDFEAVEVPEPPEQLRERLMAICEYLLVNGPVIRNGDTVGEDEKEKIRVVHAPSSFGHEDEIMQLVYESASAKKPWWKMWGH